MKRFHLHQTALDRNRAIHIFFEFLIQRVDAESDAHIGKAPDQIHIPQDEIGFRLYAELDIEALQLLKQGACSAVDFFLRTIRIRYRS